MENVSSKLIVDETSEQIVQIAEKIATIYGSDKLTVRKILKELGVTNRVFYNRFHNVDEVLAIVYEKTIMKVRESLEKEYDGKQDFFEFVTDSVVNSLVMSYDIKRQFNQYVFESDSHTDRNYEWYTARIKKWFAYAKEKDLIKDVDSEALGYAIWCFCRGYNADAVNRLPKEEAIRQFRYSFGILLDGFKK